MSMNLISDCREENIQRELPKTEPDAPGTRDRNGNSTIVTTDY